MLSCDSPLAHAQVGRGTDKTSDGGAVCFQDCPQDLSRESRKYSKYYAQEMHCLRTQICFSWSCMKCLGVEFLGS